MTIEAIVKATNARMAKGTITAPPLGDSFVSAVMLLVTTVAPGVLAINVVSLLALTVEIVNPGTLELLAAAMLSEVTVDIVIAVTNGLFEGELPLFTGTTGIVRPVTTGIVRPVTTPIFSYSENHILLSGPTARWRGLLPAGKV